MDKKEFFNKMASLWDETYFSPELFESLDRIVASFNLARGNRVLDVGCGTGVLIPFLLKAVGPSGMAYGIDFSEEMVKRAREKFKEIKNVCLEIARVEDLPYDDGFFDHVICFGAFPHFENKERALREMKRVLKKGGKLFIAHALSSAEIKTLHMRFEPVARDVLPDKDQMSSMMIETGFINVQIVDETGRYLCYGVKA